MWSFSSVNFIISFAACVNEEENAPIDNSDTTGNSSDDNADENGSDDKDDEKEEKPTPCT